MNARAYAAPPPTPSRPAILRAWWLPVVRPIRITGVTLLKYFCRSRAKKPATIAGTVYETIGPDYIDKIVRPAIRTAIRDAAVNYNVTEIYSTKRSELSDGIYQGLVEALKDKNVFVDKVLLRNIVLPQKVKNAIDDKIAAEQDAQKMEYVLQKAVKEKERKLIEAEGIANANRTIKASLSTQYLQWYYVQNLKEVLKSNGTRTVILPFDQNLTPLIDLSK